MKNQSAFLTASNVRQWIAGLEVEKFLTGKSKPSASRTSPATNSANEEDSSSDPAVAPSPYLTSSGEDYDEFLKLMQQGKRPFRKPGISVKEEYELWLAARAKARSISTSNRQPA